MQLLSDVQLTYTRGPTRLPQQSSGNTTMQHFQSHMRLITQYAAVFSTHRSLKNKGKDSFNYLFVLNEYPCHFLTKFCDYFLQF